MRIVQIEDFFHPDAGYQVNIVSKYFVRAGHEVFIICAEMEKVPDNLVNFFGKDNIADKDREFEKKTNVKVIRVPLHGYIGNRYIYKSSVFSIIKELRPDILYVHGNDTYIGIRILLNPSLAGCAVITDSHMLEMASVSRFSQQFRSAYKRLVTPHIIKSGITVIRTQDDNYVEKCLGIPLSQSPYIPLGSDVLLFHRSSATRSIFRQKYKISEDERVFIYAGKLDEAKGADLLARAIHQKFATTEKVCFVIVGKTAGVYGEQIEKELNQSENRVIRFPTQTYNDLAGFYQACDFAIFPKQCSLSFYDVQACGLPVLSEDNNINIERNSNGNGLCFLSGDVEDMRRKILYMIEMSKNEYDEMSSKAEKYIYENFNYSDTAERYIEEIEKSVKRYMEK